MLLILCIIFFSMLNYIYSVGEVQQAEYLPNFLIAKWYRAIFNCYGFDAMLGLHVSGSVQTFWETAKHPDYEDNANDLIESCKEIRR